MKTISKIMLTALSLALVACGTLGGGDTDMSANPNFQKYRGICVKYMYSRYHAALSVGDNDSANNMKAEIQKIKNAKNTKACQASLNAKKVEELDKSVKLKSEEAKKEFIESLGYMMGGIAQERKLLEIVLNEVNQLQEKVKSNPFAAAGELSFLQELADAMGTDIKTVAQTIDAYTVYATENGISMADIQAAATRAEEQDDLE